MNSGRRLITAVFLLMIAVGSPATAFPPEFGPFHPGHVPASFPLQLLDAATATSTASGTLHRYGLGPVGTLEILSGGEAAFTATLRSSGGDVLLPPTAIEGSLVGDIKVLSGRLNQDTIPDLVLETWSGGCGLAGQIGFRTILLSSKEGFVAVPVQFYAMSDEDFIDLDRDGRPEMIHTAFIDGETGKDGRDHNYWVHNLLGFDGGNLVSRNAAHRSFPAWIQYKHKPNHRRTDQLSPGQRVRLWRTSQENWFPRFERLSAEQGR